MKTNSRVCIAAALAVGATLTLPGLAGQVTSLVSFTANTPAKASEVNGNFTAVKTAVDDNDARINALITRVAALEAQLTNVTALNAYLSLQTVNGYPTVRITAANLQVVNGKGNTDSADGLGNLIVGYDELRPDDAANSCSKLVGGNLANQAACTGAGGVWAKDQKSGSHNLIVGMRHNYVSYGGVVFGTQNSILEAYSAVMGGRYNTAGAPLSSVSSGDSNLASGLYSSVLGGFGNHARGQGSTVSGGQSGDAFGTGSSITGGQRNVSTGQFSTVTGGIQNESVGESSVVTGGGANDSTGYASVVSGGANRVAPGEYGVGVRATPITRNENVQRDFLGGAGLSDGLGACSRRLLRCGGESGRSRPEAGAHLRGLVRAAAGWQSRAERDDGDHHRPHALPVRGWQKLQARRAGVRGHAANGQRTARIFSGLDVHRAGSGQDCRKRP